MSRILVVACESCGSEKPTLIACLSTLTREQKKCHQCKRCVHDMPRLKRENRIILAGQCISCKKEKIGVYRVV